MTSQHDSLSKYNEDKKFLMSMDSEYLLRRRKQLKAIILRAELEKDMIDTEIGDRGIE